MSARDLPRRIAVAALLTHGLARPQPAEAWPGRPLRFIVPSGASSGADRLARMLAETLGPRLGQAIAIENRPGAGTNIGMAAVARAAPDGLTLGLGSVAANALNRWLYRRLPFDPDEDFAPVSLVALVPLLMLVPPQLPVETVADFVAHAKAQPGPIRYGSVGAGSLQHLVAAQFGLMTGLGMQHLPCGTPAAFSAGLSTGDVQLLFQPLSALEEVAAAGWLRPIAVTGMTRQPGLPNVPTLREAGIDITATGWFGLVTPARVPEAVLDRLNREVMSALDEPGLRSRIIAEGAVPCASTRSGFAAWMAQETGRWREVVRAIGATTLD